MSGDQSTTGIALPDDPRGLGSAPAAQCRLTVVGTRRRLDLAVPDDVAIVSLMGDLIALLDEPEPGLSPRTWTLARLGHDPLPPGRSLRDLGVVDGEVLYLRDRHRAQAPSRVEDVIEAVQDDVEAADDLWSPRWRALLSLTTAFLASAALGAYLLTAAPDDQGLIAVAGGLAAALLLAGRVLHRLGRDLPASGAVLASWPVAAATGAAVPAAADLATAVASGTVALAVVITLGAAAVPPVRPPALGVAPGLLLLAGWAGCVQLGTPMTPTGGAVALLAVLLVGLLPRLAVGAGGLAVLDDVALAGSPVDAARVSDAVGRSHRTLTWSLVSVCAVALAALCDLAWERTGWSLAAGGVLALALLLRARGFLRAPQVLTVVTAGVFGAGVVAAGILEATVDAADRPAVGIAGLAGLVALLVVLSAGRLRPSAAARTRRLLDLAERLAVMAAVPVVAGLLGLYASVVERVS